MATDTNPLTVLTVQVIGKSFRIEGSENFCSVSDFKTALCNIAEEHGIDTSYIFNSRFTSAEYAMYDADGNSLPQLPGDVFSPQYLINNYIHDLDDEVMERCGFYNLLDVELGLASLNNATEQYAYLTILAVTSGHSIDSFKDRYVGIFCDLEEIALVMHRDELEKLKRRSPEVYACIDLNKLGEKELMNFLHVVDDAGRYVLCRY